MQPQYPPQQPQFPTAPPQPPYPPQGIQPSTTAPPPQVYAPPPAAPYPPQAYAPPPIYAPPMPPGYPQPQYAPPPAPIAQPLAAGSLDAFYSQPSTGGGKSLSFEAPGQSYTGIVTRPITNGDITQQTDIKTGAPSFFKDGRPKFVMRVPLMMQPSAAYPDGLAQWYCRGQSRDELVRAMAEVGAPEGAPEQGSIITITMTGTRPSGQGMAPSKQFQIHYQRPQNAPSTSAPVAAPSATPPAPVPPPPPPMPHYEPAPPPIYATNGGTTTTVAMSPPPPPETLRVNGGQPPQYAPPPPPPPAPAADLSPEQQALLATLTNQPQPTH